MLNWLKKLGLFVSVVGPLLTAVLWFDTRYMHKEISDFRFLEIQISMLERDAKAYARRIDQENYIPTEEERLEYDVIKDQLIKLNTKRNELIGVDL